MAALIQTLDTMKRGENGHYEHTWATNDTKEKIVQFQFQLTRTQKMDHLETILVQLLQSFPRQMNEEQLECFRTLYKLIGQTRDIVDGKGECQLSYMMIYTWNLFYPQLAKFALKSFVLSENDEHPFGSWKDLKYFCEYCRKQPQFKPERNDLFLYAIELLNTQLRADAVKYLTDRSKISLVAKWIPREKTKFGWIFEHLATDYFRSYLLTPKTEESKKKAVLKCKMEYRKLISNLNHAIDTLQIKQCNGKWSHINFNRTTSVSLHKQKRALLNVKKNGNVRHPDIEDRVLCAKQFQSFVEEKIKTGSEIKGKRVSIVDFVKNAIQFNGSTTELDLLNSQWLSNASQTGKLDKLIAMVDTSSSMNGDPLLAAIGLGIRVAEKSALGKRVITFNSTPEWVNLENCNTFYDCVKKLRVAPWGGTTNFYGAFQLILDGIARCKLSPEETKDMTLVVFSDMQINQSSREDFSSMFDTMKKKYEDLGMKMYQKPFEMPNILFWNLRSTNGFPTVSTQENAIMFSGFSPLLLNQFCEGKLNELQSITPWSTLQEQLNNPRYDVLEKQIV